MSRAPLRLYASDSEWRNGDEMFAGHAAIAALLAVPMQIKDRVLGVIEVINRKDGLPFVQDDQNLLTAFAGQAAV